MRRLTAQGVAPAEAAAWAQRMPDPADTSASPPSTPDTATPRDGGGHAIPVGRAGPAARGLARAAMRLDGAGLRDMLEMVIAGRGVIRRLGGSDPAGADRHRRTVRGDPALHRGRAPAVPQHHRGARRGAPAAEQRGAAGPAVRGRRGAAHPAPGGAGRRAGRGRGAGPAAGRPGADPTRCGTRWPVPVRLWCWSGRRCRAPATPPSWTTCCPAPAAAAGGGGRPRLGQGRLYPPRSPCSATCSRCRPRSPGSSADRCWSAGQRSGGIPVWWWAGDHVCFPSLKRGRLGPTPPKLRICNDGGVALIV